MVMPVALKLENVTVQYATKRAIADLSLEVHRGEIVGLLGPNGSGKSTTLAVAAGVIEPTAGSIWIDGYSRQDQEDLCANKIGLVPQETALYDELTLAQNLSFFARLYDIETRERSIRIHRALSRARLLDFADRRISTLSGGMKQRLSFACALIHDPLVVLLDEPTAALDPVSRDALFVELHRLREEGHAILLTTHHLDEAESGCDRVAFLEAGKLIEIGTARELFHPSTSQQILLYGQLKERMPRYIERILKSRLLGLASMELIGKRIRLSAENAESLGNALAIVLSEGVAMDSFRTAPGRNLAMIGITGDS